VLEGIQVINLTTRSRGIKSPEIQVVE